MGVHAVPQRNREAHRREGDQPDRMDPSEGRFTLDAP
jgi:hypothetical protein